ncbi:Transketolase-like protein 1 [Pteropus alecto]|uniref:Transketolase-like protein 1 n=1 Tax=Pteropus alecto TaxID=9402 RepID=L5K653_PTEAL|nr:Transketolase-like protein 1 [Pteropus alecto]
MAWTRTGGCVWVGIYYLVGDGESSEGSVWEALALASRYSLDNLEAIYDVNHLSHSGALPLKKFCEDFLASEVEAQCQVFWQATQVKNKPIAVVAKTFKGRGIPSFEDADN